MLVGNSIFSAEVEHIMNMLSTLLKPIVKKMKQSTDNKMNEKTSELFDDMMNDWVILQSNQQEYGQVYLLSEDDFIALYEQFQFDSCFATLFSEKSTEGMRVGNYIIEMLSSSLKTFKRYSHFTKLINRTLVTLLKFSVPTNSLKVKNFLQSKFFSLKFFFTQNFFRMKSNELCFNINTNICLRKLCMRF